MSHGIARKLTLGTRTMCCSAWARELGISRHGLELRLQHMSVEQALTKPRGITAGRKYDQPNRAIVIVVLKTARKPAKIASQALLQARWRTRR